MESPARVTPARAGLFVIAACVLVATFLAGWIAAGMRLRAATPVTIRQDTRGEEASVTVDGIVNGVLLLRTTGGVRVQAGGKMLQADEEGVVRVTDRGVLTNHVEIVVPAGKYFVASKRGQKYYPVDAASAQSIVPENRVYFASEKAAEEAGFRHW